MIRKKSSKRPRLKQRKPIPKVNPARKAKNAERAYGAKAAWIRTKPCAIKGCHRCPVIAAHTGGGGVGIKGSNANLVPLCGTGYVSKDALSSNVLTEGHHEESHRGIKTFQAKYGVDLKDLALRFERVFQNEVAPFLTDDAR